MTPEEIVSDLKHNIGHCNDLYDPYKQAIEAIKQYAKDMCNKQKNECASLCVQKADYTLTDIGAIASAPYPKELQD
jgi:hypothetical protein